MITKHRSITQLLTKLSAVLGPDAFDVVDHWEADLCAVGIASPLNHQVLAYICTFRQPKGRYALHLEVPPTAGGDALYVDAGKHEAVSFEALVSLVRQHFTRASIAAEPSVAADGGD